MDLHMNQKYDLPKTPEEIVPCLLAHINSLNVDVMLNFYHPDGMLVDAMGNPQVGREAIGKELSKYFSLGLPMAITARHIFIANDTASLVLDWSIVGKAPNGQQVHMVATANDIAKKCDDGYWRYLIDNPFGTVVRQLV